jgi:hypothetical protein
MRGGNVDGGAIEAGRVQPTQALYELVNPSDPYTLRAADDVVACAAALYLGEGAYGLDRAGEGGERLLPVLLLSDPLQWFLGRFNVTFQEVLEQRGLEIAACLDTLEVGEAADRAALEAELAAITSDVRRHAHLRTWRDQRRSSMNDIGSRARDLAEVFRKIEARRRRIAAAQVRP